MTGPQGASVALGETDLRNVTLDNTRGAAGETYVYAADLPQNRSAAWAPGPGLDAYFGANATLPNAPLPQLATGGAGHDDELLGRALGSRAWPPWQGITCDQALCGLRQPQLPHGMAGAKSAAAVRQQHRQAAPAVMASFLGALWAPGVEHAPLSMGEIWAPAASQAPGCQSEQKDRACACPADSTPGRATHHRARSAQHVRAGCAQVGPAAQRHAPARRLQPHDPALGLQPAGRGGRVCGRARDGRLRMDRGARTSSPPAHIPGFRRACVHAFLQSRVSMYIATASCSPRRFRMVRDICSSVRRRQTWQAVM